MSRFRGRAWRARARARASGGQGLVEFALVLPVFVLMLFGLIDVGRYVYLDSTLSQAAREGARLASVEASWIGSSDPSCGQAGGPVCPANMAALKADVTAAVNRMIKPFAAIPSADISIRCDAGSPPGGTWSANTCSAADAASGSVVSVRVVATFGPITPVLSNFTITTSGSATMVID